LIVSLGDCFQSLDNKTSFGTKDKRLTALGYAQRNDATIDDDDTQRRSDRRRHDDETIGDDDATIDNEDWIEDIKNKEQRVI
jgi:hypothetical protein